jgi:uncharacterized protein YbjT (DUF2867 family)
MILVAGATGNVGGALVAQLAAEGTPVRALTRRPLPDSDDAWPDTVEVAVGDLNDAGSLLSALEGVRGLFLLSGYEGTADVLAAGRDASLERVVLLGSGAVTDADLEAPEPSTNAIVAYNVEAERAVRASGLGWTVLRPSGFHSNALRWLPQLAEGDVVRGPWADVPIASIDPRDIAAVAAQALTADSHQGRALRLTGPQALTPAERVAILADVLDRPLRFEAQSDEAARAEMLEDAPAEYVDAFFRFFSNGETDETTVHPTVQQVTGRAARPFSQWAAEHATAFR